jgi:RTX calcium-binding nonapeptide repeat (4 copies)
MRAKTKGKHEIRKRFAIVIGVAAAGVMALGAQTGAQTQAPTPRGQAPPTCKGIVQGHRRTATIVGTSGKDALHGTPGRDVIVGRGGSDRLFGNRGNDLICGGAGKDRLEGGKGTDQLRGEAGNDTLNGGGGTKDICRGGKGNDTAKECES